MSKAIPWSIKGVDFDAREAAKEAARRSGMTLGEWLNSVIEDHAAENGLDVEDVDDDERLAAIAARLARPKPRKPVPRPPALNEVARRLEALELQLAGREEEDQYESSLARLESRLGAVSARRESRADSDTAFKRIERRLHDLSARVGGAPRPQARKARTPQPAPAHEQPLSLASISEAVTQITQRQRDLAASHSDPYAASPLALSAAQAAAEKAATLAVEGLRAQVESLSRTVASLAPRDQVTSLESAIRELGQRLDSPKAAIGDHLLRPVEELTTQVRKVLTDPAPQAALAAIDRQLQTLSGKMEATRNTGFDPGALRDVQSKAVEIRDLISALASRPANLEKVEQQIAQLGARIESLTATARTADTGELVRGIGEIRAALNRASPQGSLETLERRMDELGHRLDAAIAQAGSAPQLNELTRRIDIVQKRLEQPPTVMAKIDTSALERLMTDIAKKLEQPFVGPTPSVDLSPIQAEMQRLSEKIDSAAAARGDSTGVDELRHEISGLSERIDSFTALAQDASVIDSLHEQVGSLAQRIDTLANAEKPDYDALARQIGDLTSKIDELSTAAQENQLAEELRGEIARLAQQIEAGPSGAAAPGSDLLEKLQDQLVTISERLETQEQSAQLLASLDGAMVDLFRQIEDLRRAAVDAAEVAARKAARETIEAAPLAANDRAVADAVKQELAELRSLQNVADRRTVETLTAVHETLERVVNRLAVLEDEIADVRPEPVYDTVSSVPPGAPGIATPDAVSLPRVKPPVLDSDIDELLQPGMGAPANRREVEGGAPPVRAPEPLAQDQQAASTQAAFIAAARRAALAASGTSARTGAEASPRGAAPGRLEDLLAQLRGGDAVADTATTGAETPAGDQPSSAAPVKAKAAVGSRRRPLLIALAGLILVLGSLQTLRVMQNRSAKSVAIMDTFPAPDARTIQSPASDLPVVDQQSPAPASPEPERHGALAPPAIPAPAGKAGSGFSPPLASDSFDRMPVASSPEAAPKAAALPVPPPSPAKGVTLAEAANAGLASAQYEMGVRLFEGRGTAKDSRAAIQWFEKAAQQNLAPAQYRLGSMLERGMGADKDTKRARELYAKAAAQGHVRSMHNLAVLSAEGADGKPDYVVAAEWFRKAAEFGVRDSQYNVAVLYARGLGVEQNLQLSWVWFNAAAGQGDEDAAKKRDEIAVRLDASQLAAAKTMAEALKPRQPDPAANDVAPPPGGWDNSSANLDVKPSSKLTTGKGKVSSL